MSSTVRNYLLMVLVVILSIIALARKAPAAELQVLESQAMVIDGVIEGDNLSSIQNSILKRSTGTVDLVINSPGGSVITGFQFISVMEDARSRGIRFRCFVPTVAASMAFQILLHCDERHVLDRSLLLWHRARVQMGGLFGQAMTAPQLAAIARSLDSLDQLIFQEVELNVRGMSREDLVYHFEQETLHIGETLAKQAPKSFRSYPSIKGLYEILSNPKVPRSSSAEFNFMNNQDYGVPGTGYSTGFHFGEIIYIK